MQHVLPQTLHLVFERAKRFRQVFIQEQIVGPESFRVALRKELEVASLGAFNIESLLSASPTDLSLPEIREEIHSLLREKRGVR